MKWLKNIFEQAVALEKKTSPGQINQKWASWTFIAWLVSVVAGFSLSVTRINGSWWNGFSLHIGDPNFNLITAIMLLSLPVCMAALVIAQRMGWIERLD